MNNTNQKRLLKWNEVKWRLIEKRVDHIQGRIYIASKLGDKGRVHFLQNILLSSLDAKLLAVRRVTTEAKGRKTPGLDKVVIDTPEKKVELVKKLKINGLAAPIRRVWIPKPGKPEKRPLGIPIINDRAKQKLVLMALEPEWEAKFEGSSYGFRPGRSTHDAIEKIFLSVRNITGKKGNCSKYVLDADLKGCFDNINQDYILSTLDTTPKIEKQVRAWLRAGIFEGLSLLTSQYGDVKENEIGTPQGGVISPFLANVALHGMEAFLKDWILTQTWPVEQPHQLYKANKRKSITIVRYADDFVVIHRSREVVENAKMALEGWLAGTSQLKFNDGKTRVVSSSEGFNFLGFSFINIIRNNVGRIKVYPSVEKQQSIIKSIGDLCRKYRAISAYDLIKALRPKILGWANYFRYSECKAVFGKLDLLLFRIIRAWVFRRDRRNNRATIKEKYFPSGEKFIFDNREYQNNWILCGKKYNKGKELCKNHLPRFGWVASVKYVMVKDTNSTYDPKLMAYWALRTAKYGGFNLRERRLLKSQKGYCPWCGGQINDNVVEVDHIIPKSQGGKDVYANLQLLHRICHTQKTSQERANPKGRAKP
jgi:RNA-directed DNA polymerase